MKENPWKELFKGEEFMINGHEYGLENVSVDYSDDKKTIKHFTLSFRPKKAIDESGDVIFEIPMNSMTLFLKFAVSIKGAYGEIFEKVEKIQDGVIKQTEKITRAFGSSIEAFKKSMDKQ